MQYNMNALLDPIVNFGKATVSIGYNNTDTTIALNTGEGAKLPDPSIDGGSFNLVWFNNTDYADPADDPNVEIVRCISRVTDTLVLMRGQEDTSASNKNISGKIYKVVLSQTKKYIGDIQTDAQSRVDTHSALTTGVHGVGGSTIDSVGSRNTAISTHSALTSSIHNFDASGNAPPQIHGASVHDVTTVDGGASLSLATQIPLHDSTRHTGTIGSWAQIDKTTSDITDITTKSHTSLTDIGTNSHFQIDTHISSITAHGISAGLDAAKSGSPSVGQRYIAVDTLKDYECFVAGTWREITANPPLTHGIGSHTGTIGAWTQIDKTTSSIADITTKSHTSLSDIGTNTHAQIDTAITNSVSHIAATTGIHGTTGNIVATGAAVTGQYSSAKYTTTTALDWNNGNVQYIVLANGGQTFTFSNPRDGGRYMIVLKQPAGGAAGTVTWPASVLWPGVTAPTLTTTNGKVDLITFVYDGTNTKYYGGSALNY